MSVRELYKTDIEQLMFNSLKENNINFVSEFPIRCKYGYIVDFAIPEIKLIIEVDGEVWHDKEHDRKRDGYLKQNDWKVLRFKGKKVENDINDCINKIKSEIERRKKEKIKW